VPRHVARLVIDYFAYAARHWLLRLRRAPGCLGTLRGSLSTTSPTPRVQVPPHVAWLVTPLVVDYFAYIARLAASTCHAARRRLLHLRGTSECLGTSRGSSRGSSSTIPCAATSSCGHTGYTSATSCVVTTCLAATLALIRLRRALPRRRLSVTSRQPFISTSFQTSRERQSRPQQLVGIKSD
jgi:hypothetical protein